MDSLRAKLKTSRKSRRKPRGPTQTQTYPSPAELLLGRQIQDNLPRKIQSDQIHDDVIHRLQGKQAQQKYYCDKHTTVLPSLVTGQQVTIQNPKILEWKPDEVLDKVGGVPRSYIVSTPSGKGLRRNRSQIRQIPQACPKQVKFDLEWNEVRSFSPGTECSLPINQPSQSSPRSGPVSGAAQHVSPTPGAVQPVISAPSAGSQYMTCSGRVGKEPSRMDI